MHNSIWQTLYLFIWYTKWNERYFKFFTSIFVIAAVVAFAVVFLEIQKETPSLVTSEG